MSIIPRELYECIVMHTLWANTGSMSRLVLVNKLFNEHVMTYYTHILREQLHADYPDDIGHAIAVIQTGWGTWLDSFHRTLSIEMSMRHIRLRIRLVLRLTIESNSSRDFVMVTNIMVATDSMKLVLSRGDKSKGMFTISSLHCTGKDTTLIACLHMIKGVFPELIVEGCR